MNQIIYSDDRVNGPFIKSKSRLADHKIECEVCGHSMDIDVITAARDVGYRPKCKSCGAMHAFVQLNGVLIVGLPVQ